MRVLLVEEARLIRAALKALLTSVIGQITVDEAANRDEAMAAVRARSFDLVLIDLDSPVTDGVTLVREVRQMDGPPILLIASEGSADRVAHAMEAGADAYTTKQRSGEELRGAIQQLLDGRQPVQSDLRRPSLKPVERKAAPSIEMLTKREREVFDLLIMGRTAREIALALSIGVKTVETHRERIFKKLALHSVVQLVRFAARHQLLELVA